MNVYVCEKRFNLEMLYIISPKGLSFIYIYIYIYVCVYKTGNRFRSYFSDILFSFFVEEIYNKNSPIWEEIQKEKYL